MEHEQERELSRLQHEVTAELRAHGYIDEQRGWHVFQYLVMPSFEPYVSWDVFRQRSEDQTVNCILLRSEWRSDLDAEKLDSPVERLRHPYPLVPTVEIHEVPVPPKELERLVDELVAVKVWIGGSATRIGLDGTRFEVAVELGFTKCRFSWWEEPPLEWKELGGWASRVAGVFESAWAGGQSRKVPLQARIIDDAAARREAQSAFRDGHYGRAAELLAELGKRGKLTPAEEKMLEIALKRAGAQGG